MDGRSYYHYLSPYGTMTIATDGVAITGLVLGGVELTGQRAPHELTNRASTEILEYLAGKRRTFDLPIAPEGSPFERRVWDAICELTYGEQLTTRELAADLGLEESYRRVGVAVNANPIAILIPTHRIVAAPDKPRPSAPHPAVAAALLRLEAST